MNITFWGVRGSIPVAGDRTLHTGGNTTCVVVEHEGHHLVIDGGTGLRGFGESLGFKPLKATLLFTHVHWDHIQGVPFFGPAFHPGSELTFAGAARDSGGLADAMAAQMRPPQFPITLAALNARIAWRDVESQKSFDDGPFTITPLEMNHPDGVLAYRVECEGKRFVFATDQEHGERIDRDLVEFSRGADLLVHDAQYTPAEYRGEGGPCRKGWGHSTWAEAVEVGRRAGVARLGLFHHDPARTDDAVAVIESMARNEYAPSFAAREGQCVVL